jgi:hypothetical protein
MAGLSLAISRFEAIFSPCPGLTRASSSVATKRIAGSGPAKVSEGKRRRVRARGVGQKSALKNPHAASTFLCDAEAGFEGICA